MELKKCDRIFSSTFMNKLFGFHIKYFTFTNKLFGFHIKYFKILSVNHPRLVSLSPKKRREVTPPAPKLHLVISRGGLP
jgi:hypothetical protein